MPAKLPRPSIEPGAISTHSPNPNGHNGEGEADANGPNKQPRSRETTQPPPTHEEAMARVAAIRNRKIRLGGRPLREVKKFRLEDYPWAMQPDNYPLPPDIARLNLPSDGPGDPSSGHAIAEKEYWLQEVQIWERFLLWRVLDWEDSNKEAGGTLQPLPALSDVDELELHEEYLHKLKTTKLFKPTALPQYSDRQPVYDKLVADHLEAVERQVEEMRRERGLGIDGCTRDVPSSQRGSSTPKRQRDDAPGQAEDDHPAEAPPAKRTKRTKSAAGAPPAAKPSHDASAATPGPARRKAGRPKAEDKSIDVNGRSTSRPKRGATTSKATKVIPVDDGVGPEVSDPPPAKRDAKREVKPPKRSGRTAGPTSKAAKTDDPKAGSRKRSAQTNRKIHAASVHPEGLRRSARIAAKARP